MGKHAQSIENTILRRVRGWGRGSVFTPAHFLDIGSRAAIDQSLSRLVREGTIRRLGRGIYDFPRNHPRFGLLQPSPDAVVKAIARRDGTRLLPSGAYAANLLGLSQQVPMRVVYLTDGPPRHFKVGDLSIVLKRTTPRAMAAQETSGLVFQALRALGPGNVSIEAVRGVHAQLTSDQQRRLLRDLPHAPGWIAKLIKEAIGGEVPENG